MPEDLTDMDMRRWACHFFCMNIQKVMKVTSLHNNYCPYLPKIPKMKLFLNKNFDFQNKAIREELKGMKMSPRQYAAYLLNPNRMLTITFWRLLREMFDVRIKRCLREKTVIFVFVRVQLHTYEKPLFP